MIRLTNNFAVAALAGCLIGCGRAPTPKPVAPAAMTKSEAEALQKELFAARDAIAAEFKAAKTGEEREKARGKYAELDPKWVKLVEWAQANPKDPFACPILAQALSQARNIDRQRILEDLKRDHLMSEGVGPACGWLANGFSEGEELMRRIIAKNPHRADVGAAKLELAGRLSRMGGGAEQAAEQRKLLEEVKAEYADVKYNSRRLGDTTLAVAAERELKQLEARESLAEGKPAPDIKGPDLDGKEFALSDYRGKVILLDFWGFW